MKHLIMTKDIEDIHVNVIIAFKFFNFLFEKTNHQLYQVFKGNVFQK